MKKNKLIILLKVVIPVILFYLIINQLFFIGCIESGSMEPTIQKGALTISNKLAYKKYTPERGDIIIFKGENGESIVKRIIGLPGDKISFIDGYVYVNNKRLVEPYLSSEVKSYSSEKFNVPSGCYFVLGDNRQKSNDSRYMRNSYVDEKAIIGRAFYCFNGLNWGTELTKYKEK